MKRFSLVTFTATAMILGAGLSGCTTLAPYGQQRGVSGQGYSEQRIEDDRYRVSYNGVGDASRVIDFALARASDLTLNHGYEWFEVVRSWTDGHPNSAGGIRPSVSIGGGTGSYGGYRSSSMGVGLGLNITGPQPTSTTLEIIMGRGPKPNRANVYDAESVQRSIPR